MPTLDIREGAIELLMRTYKGMLPELGGYLAHGSTLDLNRVEKFIQVGGTGRRDGHGGPGAGVGS